MDNVRYIERFSTTLWKQQTEYNYTDSALRYVGPPKNTFSGIEHLEGRDVTGTIEGADLPLAEVVSGTITFSYSYDDLEDEVTVVAGLPYTATMTTSRLNPKSSIGSAFGRRQVILDVNILVNDTYEIEIGPDDDETETFSQFEREDITEVPTLYTGIISKSFPTGYDDELFVTCVSSKPTPATILNVGCLLKTSDE